MVSSVTRVGQRKTIICAITSLIFVVTHLPFSLQGTVKKTSTQNLTFYHSDATFDDCRFEVTVLNDNSMMQKWESCFKNFSEAWRNAKQHNRKPQHKHLEKDHSASLYMYTKSILQPVNLNFKSANRTGKPKETFESRSLYSFLTEGIQILKHNQVTCVRTHFKAETLLHLNISNKQVRFSTFMLGSDEWNFARNISCFEVHTCFGADITYYSALKQNNQVLIPPYEIFKVTDIQTETKECRISYRLTSNMNCVYSKESNMLHPISTLAVDGFWVIFTIICIVIICLLLSFALVKVYHKTNAVYSSSFSSKLQQPHCGLY
ncbi:ecto-ADP-ribosyltransferase 4-like [Oreochromis niloticus]|uniref:ecto-ADP-ribosyltransferase 4-like n=1 Tax=Oreochromis niloticus TaxID=8128 RepID=UPI0003942579|nr:ecto-ADP-ribosyltransferase 4-like [Oreochromis niloticus]XP_019215261.1 ecto-ADP-ribosyltransferase 4-like [Oreochromis niloticus]